MPRWVASTLDSQCYTSISPNPCNGRGTDAPKYVKTVVQAAKSAAWRAR